MEDLSFTFFQPCLALGSEAAAYLIAEIRLA